jgi:predicted transcriptional regulator
MTVSLPPEMLRAVEKARKAEHRTRSELVREALRAYLGIPIVTPTIEERAALARGRAEIARGEFVRLDELGRLGRSARQVRRKKP